MSREVVQRVRELKTSYRHHLGHHYLMMPAASDVPTAPSQLATIYSFDDACGVRRTDRALTKNHTYNKYD